MTTTKAASSLLLFTLIVATVGCDRISKHIATESLTGTPTRSLFGDLVRLEYAENTGGFMSIGANLGPRVRTAIFTIGTGLILMVVLIAAITLRQRPWHLVGACLAFAGGVSNLVDRILHGAVVDFLNIGFGEHLRTGIFNVADAAVVLGVFIMIYQMSQSSRVVEYRP
jgi:signal peptidase II